MLLDKQMSIILYIRHHITDPNYSAPQLLEIPEGTRIPFLSIDIVNNFLRKQKRSSSGPDDLPHLFWKTWAAELAPAITKILTYL